MSVCVRCVLTHRENNLPSKFVFFFQPIEHHTHRHNTIFISFHYCVSFVFVCVLNGLCVCESMCKNRCFDVCSHSHVVCGALCLFMYRSHNNGDHNKFSIQKKVFHAQGVRYEKCSIPFEVLNRILRLYWICVCTPLPITAYIECVCDTHTHTLAANVTYYKQQTFIEREGKRETQNKLLCTSRVLLVRPIFPYL